MNFEDWEPVYESILADFGFDRAADERTRDVAVDLLGGETTPPSSPPESLSGATVAVVGAAPSLREPGELDRLRDPAVDRVVAASTAADVCREAGIEVDVMVTDLDKNNATAVDLSRTGTPVVAHVHGDNLPAVREWLPRVDRESLIATTQAAPVGPVSNFGGFTDGDRAAFVADAAGADALRFVGWDFDDPDVPPMKRRKLAWAERLLGWLERRRGDRFGLLDGRRDGVDPLP